MRAVSNEATKASELLGEAALKRLTRGALRVAFALLATLQVSGSACDQKPVATQESVVAEQSRATSMPTADCSIHSDSATHWRLRSRLLLRRLPQRRLRFPRPLPLLLPLPLRLPRRRLRTLPCQQHRWSLDTPSVPVREASPVVQEHELAVVVRGNTAFALDLYRTLAEVEGNFFYSPSSISMALAMTYAGARGETERQMAETLQYHLPQDRLHASFNVLDLSLRDQGERSDGAELRVVNAVWAQDGRAFLESYLDTVTRNYSRGHTAGGLFGDAGGCQETAINAWVAAETGDRIKDLISPDAITPSTRLVLANAIYFNAGWQQPFAKIATT